MLIAAPWHVLATLRNPPYFEWTLESGPGLYHGFLMVFFVNEQLLRFLNMRYPRDYNTVPRLAFWLLHFAWLFPWSVYLPSVVKLGYKPADRAGQTRLMAFPDGIHSGFLHFFDDTGILFDAMLSRTRAADRVCDGDGRSMGSLGNADSGRNHARWLPSPASRSHRRAQCTDSRRYASALSRNPSAYSLSLGHMLDLTLDSFAYLRFPLYIAGAAFLIGAVANLRWSVFAHF